MAELADKTALREKMYQAMAGRLYLMAVCKNGHLKLILKQINTLLPNVDCPMKMQTVGKIEDSPRQNMTDTLLFVNVFVNLFCESVCESLANIFASPFVNPIVNPCV